MPWFQTILRSDETTVGFEGRSYATMTTTLKDPQVGETYGSSWVSSEGSNYSAFYVVRVSMRFPDCLRCNSRLSAPDSIRHMDC